MNFYLPVVLYLDSVRQGLITFHNFTVKKSSDYTCDPVGILVQEEATDLLQQIRHVPWTGEGVIGKFVWQAG